GGGHPTPAAGGAPKKAPADLARSALTPARPSLFTENTLYRWNLARQYQKHPEDALLALRQQALADPAGRSAVFALAELSFQHADKTGNHDYYLAAAVYAYAFLFPGPEGEHLEKLDPRARIAADIYNRGLTEGFATRDRAHVELRPGLYALPFGQQLAVRLDPAELQWANRRLVDFVPVAELEVTGLGTRYRHAGIGAPLAAEMQPNDPGGADYLPRTPQVPGTALL